MEAKLCNSENTDLGLHKFIKKIPFASIFMLLYPRKKKRVFHQKQLTHRKVDTFLDILDSFEDSNYKQRKLSLNI